jgi:hypothetical protein
MCLQESAKSHGIEVLGMNVFLVGARCAFVPPKKVRHHLTIDAHYLALGEPRALTEECDGDSVRVFRGALDDTDTFSAFLERERGGKRFADVELGL